MARISEIKKNQPNNVRSIRSRRTRDNIEALVPYLALLTSLIALAKAYQAF